MPAECQLVLDFRNTPKDTPEIIMERTQKALEESLGAGAHGTAVINAVTLTSYTGVSRPFSNAAPPFGIAPDRPLARQAQATLSAALKRDVPTKIWRFCTDAGHLVKVGVEVIGFGPGYEEIIHTVDERISIDMMVEAMVANAALALGVE